jgi:hypothetical protein
VVIRAVTMRQHLRRAATIAGRRGRAHPRDEVGGALDADVAHVGELDCDRLAGAATSSDDCT